MNAPATSRLYRPPSVESLVVAVFALFGLALGSDPIGDNSLFVHLRTGIDMVAGHGIPRVDPYSFTAHGHEWVVQSWLPSFAYGWIERIGGLGWIAAFHGLLTGVVAWLMVRLARTGSTARTIAAGGIAIGIAAPFWSARPFLVGLIALASTVLVVERRVHPAWLLPIVWVWANSHGSFPLGLAWLAAISVGAALDTRALPRDELRYVAWFAGGLALACINPLGPRLLWFPLTVGDKRSVFQTVVEWQSPDFQTDGGMLALACIALGLVVLFRGRPAFRDVLPVVGFLALGLLAVRNLAPLAVVFAPVLGRALTPGEVPTAATRQAASSAVAVVLALVALLITADAAQGKGLETSSYPVAAATWLERNGRLEEPHHIAQQVTVGCYLDLRFGRDARVFIDDRVDMFPARVTHDYRDLLRGHPRSLRLLDRYEVDTVLWADNLALVSILRQTDEWRQAFSRDGWVVFVRR